METPETIRTFWFGTNPDDAAVAAEQSGLWWSKGRNTDEAIRRRFEGCVEQAAAGELDAWTATPGGRLALVLLTDQFPRNIHRNTARAFAFDPLARKFCLDGLEAGVDRALRPIERVFFYLPLEHSESLEDQDRCVALYEALLEGVAPGQRGVFQGFLDYALRHRHIIERFGRFPHRNRLLGRASTPGETAFLKEPGSSF